MKNALPFGRSNAPRSDEVLWITNFAAPYRLPVWEALAVRYPLEVALLVQPDSFYLDAKNRGEEWSPARESALGYSIEVLDSYRVPKIARSIHFLRPVRTWKRFPARGAVVLGGWEEPAYWQALLVAKLRGARTVGFYESISLSQTHRTGLIAAARSFFFKSLDAVVVPGPAASAAIQQMGVNPRNISEGFNAVDVAAFAEARRLSERSHDLQGHRFIYVGRLIGLKNIASIVRAFALIASLDDTLTVVGGGEQHDELVDLVESLSLGGQVFFLGPVPYSDLPGVIAQYDTLVLASLTEVWGLVVNEALAAGLHCVVGRRCGVAASVRHMRGVYIVDHGIDELASGMSVSRGNWTGPIAQPEILEKTPESFALVFADAIHPIER
ncbi:glycosyltransferase [Arthrobacter sp. TMS2-4]